MDFELTADQTELRHALRDLLRSVCSPATVRESWRSESNTAVVSEVLRHLSAIGVLGVLAPVELDGMGGNEIDLAVLMEECGRFAVPGPLAEHAAVGVPVSTPAGVIDSQAVFTPPGLMLHTELFVPPILVIAAEYAWPAYTSGSGDGVAT